MKSPALIATATALTGFAAGWLLKPSPAPVEATAPASSGAHPGSSARFDTKSRERDERPLVLKARGSGREDDMKADPEASAAHQRFEQTFGNATDRAEKARLNRLVEALGLSPEQQQTMEVLLANRRDGFRQLQGNGKSPAEMVQQASLAEQRFQEDVKKLLDPEQVAALDSYREREKQNDIEARAQRDLADLIGQIDLSGSQRDQALEVLREQSEHAAGKRPPGWALMNETLNVFGGQHVTILEDMGDIMADPDAMKNTQEVHRRLLEAQRATMNTKLSALQAILTPGQYSQYRAALEARSSFMEQFTPPSVDRR